MEKFKELIVVNLLIGWIHLITFTLFVLGGFGLIIYHIYDIIDNDGQLQNLVLVLVAGFFSLTVFGSLAYASHEFIRGLKTSDHTRMLMFRICIFVLFILSCGYGTYILLHVYNGSIDISEDYALHRMIACLIIFIFELIVWILVHIVYHKLRDAAKKRRLEKLNRRKLNTVAEQLTILQPAYFPEVSDDKAVDDDQENCEKPVEEVVIEKTDKADVSKKPQITEKVQEVMNFIENEQAVVEKAFEKIHIEPKVPQEKLEDENFPPPPVGF